jgi:glycosyltransferase involved in cell wall biosynthesis
MRISVVTPSYNLAPYVEETLASVIAGLRPGDEYFVIDGGSTDGSAEIIARHAERLTAWVSEPDRGYADAIAKGFARATGDILCWINVSDLLLPGALDAVRRVFAEHPADLIFGDDFYIDEDSRVLSFNRGVCTDLRSAMLFGGWTPLQDACFWRREAYQAVGGIDPEFKAAADYDLFLRMAARRTSRYEPQAFSAYRRHAGQKSISESPRYEQERRLARRRELAHGDSTGLQRLLALRYWFTVRFRVRILQRFWHLPELAGRPVRELPCGRYWPRHAASR